MKLIEVFANRRSGHHFFMSWLVSNLSGKKDTKIKDLNKITWVTDEICHYNDATYHAFFDEEKVKSEIKEIIEKEPKYFIINYEESGIINKLNGEGSLINKCNPFKVVFLRDFLNTMASKWAVSETDLKEFYFGFKHEKQIIENINSWKIISKDYLKDETIGLTYEELLTDKNRRNEFLQNFDVIETIKPNEIQGTKSSFSTSNFNERYQEVEFNNLFNKLVINDNELHSLINKLSYNKVDIIL